MMTIGMLNGLGVLDFTKKHTILKEPHPDLSNNERGKLFNSIERIQKHYEELGNKTEILEGSIEDGLRKGELAQDEFKALLNWINNNTEAEQYWNDGYDENIIKIFHTSKSIDEFKEKWLDFQESQKQYMQAFRTSESIDEFKEKTKELETKSNDKKLFSPIKREVKSETYKADDNSFLKKLLENKFSELEELKILFGIDTNKLSDDNYKKLISTITLGNIGKNKVDIKA